MRNHTPSTHKLHLTAEKLREEDKLSEALILYDKVISLYENDNDFSGAAEAYLGKFLTYKHLYLLSKKEDDARKGYEAIYASEKLVKQHDITALRHVIEFQIGSWFRILEKYAEAAMHFKIALAIYEGSLDLEKGDYQYHLGYAQYKSGEKEMGKKNLLQGLAKIQKNRNNGDGFLAKVWESGAHMSMVDAFIHDEPEEAKKHFLAAETIITSDERLIIRKRQLELLRKQFTR